MENIVAKYELNPVDNLIDKMIQFIKDAGPLNPSKVLSLCKVIGGNVKIDEEIAIADDGTDMTGSFGSATENLIDETINYSFNEISAFPSRILEYVPFFYEKTSAFPMAYESEEESGVDRRAESASLELWSMEEAEGTFMDTQYATILGSFTDVSNGEREKFNQWIMFNPAEFGLILALHSFTREVNYAPLR